jgi:hypothetical protein
LLCVLAHLPVILDFDEGDNAVKVTSPYLVKAVQGGMLVGCMLAASQWLLAWLFGIADSQVAPRGLPEQKRLSAVELSLSSLQLRVAAMEAPSHQAAPLSSAGNSRLLFTFRCGVSAGRCCERSRQPIEQHRFCWDSAITRPNCCLRH